MLTITLFAIATALHLAALAFALRMAWRQTRGTPWMILGVTLLLMMWVRVFAVLASGSEPYLVVPRAQIQKVLGVNATLVSGTFLLGLFLIRKVVVGRE